VGVKNDATKEDRNSIGYTNMQPKKITVVVHLLIVIEVSGVVSVATK